jgi:hypothetical protein
MGIVMDSFIFDVPALLVLGAAEVYLCVRYLYKKSRRRWALPLMGLGTVGIFWLWSLALYLECPWAAWMWKICGAESGRDWMINSGILNIQWEDGGVMMHLIAGALFALYPFWLWLGVQIGYMLFGRNERQTGFISLL